MDEEKRTLILTHSMLMMNLYTVCKHTMNILDAPFAYFALLSHSLHGFFVVYLTGTGQELDDDQIPKKVYDQSVIVSRTLAFPLMAVQLTNISFPDHCCLLPLVHLAVPMTELTMMHFKGDGDERWYSEDVVIKSKAISWLLVALGAFSCRNRYMLTAAIFYLSAETWYGEEAKDKPNPWAIPTALGDWLATAVVFCSVFGLAVRHT